jgi:hypothetical protein
MRPTKKPPEYRAEQFSIIRGVKIPSMTTELGNDEAKQ